MNIRSPCSVISQINNKNQLPVRQLQDDGHAILAESDFIPIPKPDINRPWGGSSTASHVFSRTSGSLKNRRLRREDLTGQGTVS
jgi:hypothetical protein